MTLGGIKRARLRARARKRIRKRAPKFTVYDLMRYNNNRLVQQS